MKSFKVDGIGYPQQVIKAEHPQKAARKFAESNNMLGELLNNGGKEFIAVVSMYYQVWEFMVEVISGEKLKITKIAEW